MPRTKKTKLENLKQVHAKVDSKELTSLDQVWGFNELSRYGTIDEGEYSVRLRDMTRSDLENHARSVGCMVLESSERMREALLKQFRAYVLSLQKPASPTVKSNPLSRQVQQILNEGR
jgi:hypothetical protein